eukprot:5609581-Amphidinium_carterae.1
MQRNKWEHSRTAVCCEGHVLWGSTEVEALTSGIALVGVVVSSEKMQSVLNACKTSNFPPERYDHLRMLSFDATCPTYGQKF